MSTARAAKRDLVAQILAAQIPSLASRIYRARVWPLKLPQLPAILVFGWNETKTRSSLDPWTHLFEVNCGMAVQARIQAFNGPDAEIAMEDMADKIEAALLTSPLLLGLDGSLERIDRVETKLEASAEAETVMGTVSISFDLIWTERHAVIVPAGETLAAFQIGTRLATP